MSAIGLGHIVVERCQGAVSASQDVRLQHLARIEYPFGIEGALERAHQIVRDRILYLGQEIALHDPDPMLGRD